MYDRVAELDALQAEMRACSRCVAAGLIGRAVPVFAGRASDRVMLIGQAPGLLTEGRRLPFGGPAGRALAEWFDRAGFPSGYFRERTYLTSLTRCFPGKSPSGSGDRPPSRAERALCRGFLDTELRLVSPRLIVLVGKLAIDEFIGKRPLDEIIGESVERDGIAYLPLPHSSGVSRWLNDPAHLVLLDRAIARLDELRIALELG